MAATTELMGTCLCGAIRILATPKAKRFGACHCDTCRRWGGGPLLAVECGSAVRLEGDATLATFSSSEWAERGFCRACGTHLFYRLKESGDYAIPLGLFADGADWRFTEQIFVDRKPPYYTFAEATRDLTGAEVFAAYGAGGSAET